MDHDFDDDDRFARRVRPRWYQVVDGRTRPDIDIRIEALVKVTARGMAANQWGLKIEHREILGLAGENTSVAEIAAKTKMPLLVAMILSGDLVKEKYLTLSQVSLTEEQHERPDVALLNKVLDRLKAV
ncbi:MAG: DUF742 domain-containing protein [Acidimicrobiales bacterium]